MPPAPPAPCLTVGLDATPLLGTPTGVGRYVAGLVTGLLALPDPPALTLTAFTARGARSVPAPHGARVAGRPFPARALQALWARSAVPPVEWLSGRCAVFHATNYVLPPARRAAGVVSVHDLAFERWPQTVTPAVLRYRALVPRSLRRARVVLTLSDTVASEIRDTYPGLAPAVRVARPGVDPGWAAAVPPDAGWRQAHALPERYLLFVGSTEPRKNLPTVLAAVRDLHAAAADAPVLVLAGPAGWGAPLDLAGLPPGAVRRLGYLPDAELRRVVAGATALVYPTRYEGFGLPPLEALACGVPTVCSDLPVLREVTGPHARYVPATDVAAWTAALDAAWRAEPDPARQVAGRAHAARFTWSACAEAALAAYREALG